MSVSPEVLTLIQEILNGECDRSALARWLASRSLRFLESNNEVDRMILADLDAALGEIQRGAQEDSFLFETANELAKGLALPLTDRKVTLNLTNSAIDVTTGTGNTGGSSMAVVEVEVVPSSS